MFKSEGGTTTRGDNSPNVTRNVRRTHGINNNKEEEEKERNSELVRRVKKHDRTIPMIFPDIGPPSEFGEEKARAKKDHGSRWISASG